MFQPGGIACAADTMQEEEEDKEEEAAIEGEHPGSRATVGSLLIFCWEESHNVN